MINWFHIGFFLLCLFASGAKNLLVWKPVLSDRELARVRMFDKISAAAAGLLTVSGLAMLFWFAKPIEAYLTNDGFWAKMALFITASALIVWTKVDFRAAAAGSLPWRPSARVRAILAFDFVGLMVLASIGRWLAQGGQ